ncbi:MAG: hypothetical protein ACYDHW_06015 [Syntrophorhabdaceae bacterium]
MGLLLVLVMLGIALTHNALAAPYRHERTGLVFPETVNSLKLVRATDYEPLYAGLGSGISYRTETIRADIFLYDLKQGPIPEGTSNSVVNNEFEQALNDIVLMEKQGTYKNVSILVKKEIALVGPKLKFIHGILTYQQNNIKLISHLYLTGHSGVFMKLRITYLQEAGNAEEENLIRFLSMIDDITRSSK